MLSTNNMAAASSSSSSIIASRKKYEVFLSFRGEDTRDNFTSHLHHALLDKNIKTYIDYRLERGDEIGPALLKAIDETKLAVIILSENYATSSWCLDELVHILQPREGAHGLIVIPVFYGVDPSDIRRQRKSYSLDQYAMDKISAWKVALKKVAKISGWDSTNTRPDSKLVEEIVADIEKKLNHMSSNADPFKGLVGIDKRVKSIESMLRIESERTRVRIVGIWGMGGIGKTTLATVVFKRLISRFESSCFLANVREEWKEGQRKHYLHNKLFSNLLDGKEVPNMDTPFAIAPCGRKKVLVVLDDVNDPEQLTFLVGDQEKFGFGSRIIVTTRDDQVLRNGADEYYRVEELNYNESLELFLLDPYKKNSPLTRKQLWRVMEYAKGIPLALEVLRSSLHSRSEADRESALDDLKIASNKVQDVLKISYNGLDDIERQIFLDIACFLKGEGRDDVEKLLGGDKKSPHYVISNLIAKSLVSIRSPDKLWMHDLVQEMGWKIARGRSEKNPEKSSRLWEAQEICHVLGNNIGTSKIEGIFLDTREIEELNLSPTVFKNMYILRLLKIHGSYSRKIPTFHEGLEFLPNSLTYIYWEACPLKSLPSNFLLRNIVEFNMPNSQAEQLWTGVQDLPNLKKIDLSYSRQLIILPDLSKAPNIESIYLHYCDRLREISSNFRYNKNLRNIDLDFCFSLKEIPLPSDAFLSSLQNLGLYWCKLLESLPTTICKFESLESLYLPGCIRLKAFPEILEPMERLHTVDISYTPIIELPCSIDNLIALKRLNLSDCKRLQFIPTSISKLTSLEELYLYGCTKLKSLPKLPPSLERLDASSCTSLERVSSSKIEPNHKCDAERFVFWGCSKLNKSSRNNIMADARRRILRMAALKGGNMSILENQICYPGSRVPAWFKEWSSGYKMSITYPLNCRYNTGMVICVVIKFKAPKSRLYLSCHNQSQFPDGKWKSWCRRWSCDPKYSDEHRSGKTLNSNHIFFFYDNSFIDWYFNLAVEHGLDGENTSYFESNNSSFYFCLIKSNGRPLQSRYYEVKSCGLRFIHTQEIEELYSNYYYGESYDNSKEDEEEEQDDEDNRGYFSEDDDDDEEEEEEDDSYYLTEKDVDEDNDGCSYISEEYADDKEESNEEDKDNDDEENGKISLMILRRLYFIALFYLFICILIIYFISLLLRSCIVT